MSGPDCFTVVRAAGERTEAACARLATLEAGEDHVALIREVPFAKALRRGFEVGVDAGRAWTLCLDADVLLRPGAIAALVAAAEESQAREPGLFEIEGRVADKLLGQLRPAGVHLYHTALLPEALAEAEFDAKKRRPETRVKKQMAARGHRHEHVALVSGLHDHEQFHRDIFRKVFTHARKHDRFMRYAQAYWKRVAKDDDDFRVALLSYRLSAAINETTDLAAVPENELVSIDMRRFPANLDAILVPAGLAEKPPLDPASMGPDDVEAALAAFEEAQEFIRARPVAAAAGAVWPRRMKAHVEGYGYLGALRTYGADRAHAIGRLLGGGDR